MKTTQDDPVVEFIRTYRIIYGFAPTIREIGDAVGLASTSSVAHRLRALRRQGRVAWVPGHPRTLRVIE